MRVLDASAVVDVALGRSPASWVLDAMAGQELVAPGHQLAEIVSALARLHRARVIDQDEQLAAVREAVALRQQVRPATESHLLRALTLSDRIRVLDGLYVALAEELACPLVTTDQRLARSGAPCTLLSPPQAHRAAAARPE